MSLRPRANTTAVVPPKPPTTLQQQSSPIAAPAVNPLEKIAKAQASNGDDKIAAAIEKALQEQANVVNYTDLNPTEQAVAQLGVAPNALGGMRWLNEAHYKQLQKDNAIEAQFGRRLEAFSQLMTAAEGNTAK